MKLLTTLCVCLVLTLSLGCGSNDGRVVVTGEVTFDGKPLEDGNITFGGDKGAAGAGKIVNGKFSLAESGDEDGVQPGSYDVLISSWFEERGSVREDGSFSPGKDAYTTLLCRPKEIGPEGRSKKRPEEPLHIRSEVGR